MLMIAGPKLAVCFGHLIDHMTRSKLMSVYMSIMWRNELH